MSQAPDSSSIASMWRITTSTSQSYQTLTSRLQHLPAKRTWPEAQPSQRAWSTLPYNNNTTPNEHDQLERTARSTTGSESCGAHFLVTPPQRERSTIVQKHTSRSTTGSSELPSTCAPGVASKKKHAQFPRSMARTYANKCLSLYPKHRLLAYTHITGKLSNTSWTPQIQKDGWLRSLRISSSVDDKGLGTQPAQEAVEHTRLSRRQRSSCTVRCISS